MTTTYTHVHRQCCVCMLPSAPPTCEDITHGYHRECFYRQHHKEFSTQDMEELLADEAMNFIAEV